MVSRSSSYDNLKCQRPIIRYLAVFLNQWNFFLSDKGDHQQTHHRQQVILTSCQAPHFGVIELALPRTVTIRLGLSVVSTSIEPKLLTPTPQSFSMTASPHTVEVSDDPKLTVDPSPLAAAVKEIFGDFGFEKSELSIALVDDANIRSLNNQYLQHDYATDVISFVIDATEDSIVGQLIVSTETAQRVAERIGVPFEHELMLYVVHGTLHLVGLDDTDESSAAKMRAAEADYLGRFDIAHVWETDLESTEEH